ncbi:hypothetical protein CRG98_010378 [Punica granatum]|uniref:Uncharacterized protein n=1 Tax=Punica granatum TaxID=22663 RepID=A0A2I0KL53_PUNGR|nr:hypothetical protein CRG98_010378 [Punica granatum]
MEKMKNLGFDPSLFVGAITSGELTHQYQQRRDDAWFAALGRSCIHMTWSDRGAISLEGLGLRVVENICATKRIPMVVANPDFVTVEARALRVMPGTLAAKYEKLGGEVKLMGRPGKIIYEEAMKMAGLDATDAVALGDSLHHDIKGANAAGIESAFISCGIHAAELGLNSFGEVADVSRVQGLASKFDARPSFVLPAFIW